MPISPASRAAQPCARPFFPSDPRWWPAIAESIAKPWSREAALMDLCWWQDQVGMGRESWPGRPTLGRRWGWTDWAVKQALRSESEWADRLHSASPPPARRQPAASPPPATEQLNADNHADSASPPPARHQPAASEPPRARFNTSTPHTEHLDTIPELQPPPPSASGPLPADAGQEGEPLKPAAADPAAEVWSDLMVIRAELHPGKPRTLTLTTPRRKNLGARIAELQRANLTRADLLAAARWVYISDRPQARGARDTGEPIEVLLRPSHAVAYTEQALTDANHTTTQPSAKPWLEPCAGPPRPIASESDARLWLDTFGPALAATDRAIAAAGGGPTELRHWLTPRVSNPDAVLAAWGAA